MGSLFSKPKIPTVQPAPPVIAAPAPVSDSAAVMSAADEERRRLAGARGRSATILGGAAAYAPGADSRPTLLGAG